MEFELDMSDIIISLIMAIAIITFVSIVVPVFQIMSGNCKCNNPNCECGCRSKTTQCEMQSSEYILKDSCK